MSAASNIQHATRMCRILMPSVACLALTYFFFTRLTNGMIFEGEGGGGILNVKCFAIPLQLLSEIFLIRRRIQRDIVINVLTYSCNVSVILARF